MFYPFKPRKQPDFSAHASKRLKQKIRKMQQDWGLRLNQPVARAPSRKLKIGLVLTMITLCLIAAFLIYRGFSGDGQTRAIRSFSSVFGSISVPKGPTKLQRLEWYLDSLERVIVKDSIDYLNKTKGYEHFQLH